MTQKTFEKSSVGKAGRVFYLGFVGPQVHRGIRGVRVALATSGATGIRKLRSEANAEE
jgi:hypothetical protein